MKIFVFLFYHVCIEIFYNTTFTNFSLDSTWDYVPHLSSPWFIKSISRGENLWFSASKISLISGAIAVTFYNYVCEKFRNNNGVNWPCKICHQWNVLQNPYKINSFESTLEKRYSRNFYIYQNFKTNCLESTFRDDSQTLTNSLLCS